MRRKSREADEAMSKQILKNSGYGVLSTIGEDGYPYGVPVNFVYDGEKIYFHCAKDAGHKQENLKFSDRVSFTAVESCTVIPEKRTTKYRSAIAFGRAAKSVENKRYALELLVKKYSPGFTEAGLEEIDREFEATDIFEILPEKISGKINA